MKTYNELMTLSTFEERIEYLRLYDFVGNDKFGYMRTLNQDFYKSYEWQRIKNRVIARDHGCDLGCCDHPIYDTKKHRNIIVHHIVPPTIQDYMNHSELLTDENNLITVSDSTHRYIHYGHATVKMDQPTLERTPNDTCPWKK